MSSAVGVLFDVRWKPNKPWPLPYLELSLPTEINKGERVSAPTPSALAIEYPHLVFIVAGPSDRGRRYGFLDTTDLRRREHNLKGAE